MFEVHVSDKPVRVKSYSAAVEIANQFARDYNIYVAITGGDDPKENPLGSYQMKVIEAARRAREEKIIADGGPRND